MSKLAIPESWAYTSIGEVVEQVQYGANASAKEKGDLKLLRITDITEDGVDWESVPFCNLSKLDGQKYRLNDGDIVFARTGATVGKSFRISSAPNNAIFASYLIRLLPKEPLKTGRYFHLFFSSPTYWDSIREGARGAAQPNVNAEILKAIRLPLPPLDEQKRIVAKIESTQEKIKTIEQGVTKAEELIAKYREALLQKAFRGELVPQDPKDEPASKLLERIRADRAKQTDGKKKKKDDLPPIKSEEIPFEIPKSWEWVRLKEIVSLLGDGLHGTPEYDTNGDYYFINGNNLVNGRIVIKDGTKRISRAQYETHKRLLDDRTVLVSINGTIGNVAFYNGEKVILGKSACYFNLLSGINRDYIKSLINSSYFLNYANNSATGSTIMNVSLNMMREFLVPLPPILEQARLVSALNGATIAIDSTRIEISRCVSVIGKLRQSILKSAFSGRLVPQDLSEGTGHALLKKIKQTIHQETAQTIDRATANVKSKKRPRTKK